MKDFALKELIPDFVASARENLDALYSGLLALEAQLDDKEALEEVYRRAHNLKGAALTIGFEKIGDLAHSMENLLRDFSEGKKKPSLKVIDLFFKTLDRIDEMLGSISTTGEEKGDIEDIKQRLASISDEDLEAKEPAKTTLYPRLRLDSAIVRVPVKEFDSILNLLGEMVVSKGDLNKRLQDLIELGEQNKGDQRLNTLVTDLEKTVEGINYLIEDFEERLMRIRMQPISTILKPLQRTVRELAKQFGKKIDFQVEGERTRVDKRILNEIADPLLHLIRNAIDHGIESPEEREKVGKDPRGLLKISARHQGGRVIIEIEDDGRGIDVEEVKRRALEKGLATEEEIKGWDQRDVLNLLCSPGFSTQKTITSVSGRGIGMNVVKNNIEKLKGTMSLSFQKHRGTKITLYLPLTLITDKALLIRLGEETFAIPITFVEKTIKMAPKEIHIINNKRALVYQDQIIPLVSLGSLLGCPTRGRGGLIQVVVLKAFDKRVAFQVDDLLDQQEIVIKSLGTHLRRVDRIAGASILVDGKVVLILDVPFLILSAHWEEAPFPEEKPPPSRGRKPTILVVEDQLTTQHLEKSILEAAGFEVDTARDGIQALAKLSEKTFDLVLTDIRMPNMDGFALTNYIKTHPKLQNIPVVVVSSMEKEEDKRRGLEAGADAYIVKSKFDQENLIDTIRTLIT